MTMFYAICSVAALVGAALAAVAALSPETGVTGTPGAFLALAGALAVTLAAGLLAMDFRRLRGLLFALAALAAGLTALAAWFLMQTGLLAAMALALAALLAGGISPARRPAS